GQAILPGELARARVPLRQLLERVSVLEREHRRGVGHRFSRRGRGPAHPPGGRVGALELGVFFLEAAELPHAAVVFGVAHLDPVFVVVEAVVTLDLAAELFDPLPGSRRIHRPKSTAADSRSGSPGGSTPGAPRPLPGLRYCYSLDGALEFFSMRWMRASLTAAGLAAASLASCSPL